jgi:2-polyprenyl-6-methoxyphenol hydroxylase-like FAD-dependent oxidoreductase
VLRTLIVGGDIAGPSLAGELARRGLPVTIHGRDLVGVQAALTALVRWPRPEESAEPG